MFHEVFWSIAELLAYENYILQSSNVRNLDGINELIRCFANCIRSYGVESVLKKYLS